MTEMISLNDRKRDHPFRRSLFNYSGKSCNGFYNLLSALFSDNLHEIAVGIDAVTV